MERREAPGACEAPLGGPCDRPACAPCEGARPRSKRGLRLPALHLQSSWRSLRKLDCVVRVVGAPRPVPPSNVTRDDALCEQGALNIRAVCKARISYFRRRPSAAIIYNRRLDKNYECKIKLLPVLTLR